MEDSSHLNPEDLEERSEDEEEEWMAISSEITLGDSEKEVVEQYRKSMEEPLPEEPVARRVVMCYRQSLKAEKIQISSMQSELYQVKESIINTEESNQRYLDTRFPVHTSHSLLQRLRKESSTEQEVKELKKRRDTMEANIAQILKNQEDHKEILKQLLLANTSVQPLSIQPLLLDDNKKGENIGTQAIVTFQDAEKASQEKRSSKILQNQGEKQVLKPTHK